MDDMKLKSLHVYARHGQPGYNVTAEFSGNMGDVKLHMPDELGTTIVVTCLDAIVSEIQSAVKITTESLLRGPEVAAKEIEHRP